MASFSLRSIVMDIEKLTPEQILKKEIGTGAAWFYDVKKDGAQLTYARKE